MLGGSVSPGTGEGDGQEAADTPVTLERAFHGPDRRVAGSSPAVTASWTDLLAIATVGVLVAVAARVPLLWDDPWAPGYDGWYYVLQARSVLAGEPLFADASLVHPVLAAIGWLVGDVVVGNKIAACLFAGLGAAGVAIGASRWTRHLGAGLVAGLWWAAAPGHLVVTGEFLKNEAGLAVLGLLLAVLPRCERSWTLWVPALLLAGLGPLVHKVTGVFGLVLVLGYAGVQLRGRLPVWAWVAGGVGLGGVALGLGVLRVQDLARFVAESPAEGPRFALLWTSERLPLALRISTSLAHVLPLALAGLMIGRGGARLRAVGLPLVLVAVATTALGLPFGFDLTSWRLLILAFVPATFVLAALTARAGWWMAAPVGALSLLHLLWSVPHVARAEPDYQAWSRVLPVLQEHVPAHGRVVAHRGLCGFVWAVGDRVCENFDPQGPAEGWWRIAFGMGEARLAPYSAVPPVPLRPAYTLVPESAWRAFRQEHAQDIPLVLHPMNPSRPRPGFVYGPGGDTPDPAE